MFSRLKRFCGKSSAVDTAQPSESDARLAKRSSVFGLRSQQRFGRSNLPSRILRDQAMAHARSNRTRSWSASVHSGVNLRPLVPY